MVYKSLDGSFQVSGTVFGFTLWTVVLPVLSNSNLQTHNMNKESRVTNLVLSELWHDRGERRLISSGDSMAYEYAIREWLVFALTWIVRRSVSTYIYVSLVALREATED